MTLSLPTCIFTSQIIRNPDEGLRLFVESTKLHSKMHIMHIGRPFGVLFAHHPDTARAFFGSGEVSVFVNVWNN